jgi:hypothetical protein
MRGHLRTPIAAAVDAAAVVLFAGVGRRNHDDGSTITDVLTTAAPFLIGLGVAWLAVRAWRRPVTLFTGLSIWPIVVLVGMIARRGLFDRGTATSFVVVATVFLGATLVGWRAGWQLTERRRQASGGSLIAR